MHLTFFIFFTTVTLACFSQSVSTGMGGRSLGLANATAAVPDEWSLRNNPAGMTQLPHTNIAFALQRMPMLVGANRLAFVANAPLSFGVISAGGFRFGDDLYNEHLLSLGFAHAMGLASLGARVDYIQYRAEGFATASSVGLSVGGLASLSSSVSVGAYVSNINRPRLPNHERVPVQLVAGASFKPNQHVLLTVEAMQYLDFYPTIKGAFEYSFKKKFFTRTGFNLLPNAGFFGLGLHAWRLKIDYAIQYSWTLSVSHQVSAIYQVNKKKRAAR